MTKSARNFAVGVLAVAGACSGCAAPAKEELPPIKPPVAHQSGTLYGTSHAVVVGIDEYEMLPKLNHAVADARAVAELLQNQGFDVHTFMNAEATHDALVEWIGDSLPDRMKSEDRFLFYFAGHGISVTHGESSPTGYLMPVDSNPRTPRKTAISMQQIQSWFGEYPAKHVLLVADACYSGLALSTRSVPMDPGSRDYLKQITSRRVRFSLVAGEDTQEAHETSGSGVFTKYLIQGIQGAADLNHDQIVTGEELSAFIKPAVSTFVRREFGAAQTPQSAREGMGEFVFLLSGSAVGSGAPSAGVAPALGAQQTKISSRDFTLDGLRLGDFFAKAYGRGPYAFPCDDDAAEDSGQQVMFYGALPCRAQTFPEETSVAVLLNLQSGERAQERKIDAIAWLGGDYFGKRSNFPLSPGAQMDVVNATLGKPVASFAFGSIIAYKHAGIPPVYSMYDARDERSAIGFVIGNMPSKPGAGSWDAISQLYDRYTPVKYKPRGDAQNCRVTQGDSVVVERQLTEPDMRRAADQCYRLAREKCEAANSKPCAYELDNWGKRLVSPSE